MGSKISSEQPVNTANTDNIIQKKAWIQKLFCIQNNRKFILGIIDLQNDFFEQGKLPVSNANKIIGPINKLQFICHQNKARTFISQNLYPQSHISFTFTHNKKPFSKIMVDSNMNNQDNIIEEHTILPSHCIKNSLGAEFHPDLFIFHNDKFIKKNTNTNVKSYSAFGNKFDDSPEDTGLDKWLQIKNPTDIILVGIGIQSSISNTALEAIKKGYSVHLILSCICTSESNQQIITESNQKLKSAGVIFYDNVINFVFANKTFFSNTNIFL
jgi:nicotinamidase-related amidase